MKAFQILVAEDSLSDSKLILRALKTSKLYADVHLVGNGVEALAYLTKQKPYEAATAPDLVLLDLNLPKVDGREVLKYIRNDENLKNTPVVVLTTSDARCDRETCKSLKADLYLVKPMDYDEFPKLVQQIDEFASTASP